MSYPDVGKFMKKMVGRIFLKYGTFAKAMVLLVVCSLITFICTPLPTTVGSNDYPIQLGLGDGTFTTSIFSGQPIIATISLPDSATFGDIAWHLGTANYVHPNIAPSVKQKSFKVELFWTSLPIYKDSITKQLFDSVYVSIAGETKRSNSVRIYVTNVPPVFDSLLIGNSGFKTGDTIRYTVSDTSQMLTIKAKTSDINQDALKYGWYSSRGVNLPLTPIVTYPVPQDKFSDTIVITVYDGKGGQSEKVLFLTKLPPDNPPVIDSIKVGTKIFGPDSSLYLYSVRQIDTVGFTVYAHDPDAQDTITASWARKNSKDSLIRNPGTSFQVKLLCDSLYKKPCDSMRTVDTITATVRDLRGTTVKKSIRIIQGYIRHVPHLDSISVNGMMQCKGSVLLSRDSVRVGSRAVLKLKFFVSNIDSGDTSKLTVKAKLSSQITKTSDSTAQYVCKDSLYTDTVVSTVKDLAGDSAIKRIVITVIDRAPLLDSIRVNGKIQCKGTALIAKDTSIATRKDTLMLRVFSSDSDAGDTVKLTVKAKQTSQVTKLSDTVARYICKDSLYTDTIVCIVKDLAGDSAIKRIVISVVNRAPLLDSIGVNGKIQCKGTVLIAKDTAIATRKDTLMLRVFSSDSDKGDTVKLTVKAKQSSRVTIFSDTIARYVCKDSLYTDTIVCIVKDLAGDSAVKRIIVSVVNHPPLLDSIRVNGVMVCKGTPLSASYPANGKDTFMLRIYASDPDLGDSVKCTVTSKKNSCLTILSDTTARYVCKDSLYTDTISCVARDLAKDSAKKSVILTIVNRSPVCDSIYVLDSISHDTLSFRLNNSPISGQTMIGLSDSVKVRLYAHDPDSPKDSIALVQWTLSSGKAVKRLDTKGFFVQYPGQTAAYSDTVSVQITDTKLKSSKMSLIFKSH